MNMRKEKIISSNLSKPITFITEGRYSIHFLEGEYEPDRYYQLTAGYSNEPEGGKRCAVCFRMRLEETAKMAKRKGYSLFTTTLTVSPHKNYPQISAIGKELEKKWGNRVFGYGL